jgi:hypothetical protein
VVGVLLCELAQMAVLLVLMLEFVCKDGISMLQTNRFARIVLHELDVTKKDDLVCFAFLLFS